MKNCPACGKEHDNKGDFCSRSCSCKRVITEEQKAKTRRIPPIEKFCGICNKSLGLYHVNCGKRKIFLCRPCKKEKEEKEFLALNRICEKCGKPLTKKIGEGRFCSRSCACSQTWSAEDKLKRSIALKQSERAKQAREKQKQQIRVKREKKGVYLNKICPICKKEFAVVKSGQGKIFCSRKCYDLDINFEFKKKTPGGLRQGSSRGKHGWYQGYWCDSSWELAWVIYNLEHNIKFERNHQDFEYEFEGKIHKYYPDFILEDGSYLEIKAVLNEQNIIKINSFKGILKIIRHEEIKPYLDYVIEKYGKDFIKLYMPG